MRPTTVSDDQGFTIVIVALAMTIIVTIAAIVIDVGNTYATHRQVQNAVDAASMAGTRQLAKGATGATIMSAVNTQISANGADVGTVDCRIIANTSGFPFVTVGGDPLSCGSYTSRVDYPTADGVWVKASKTNTAFFGSIVNANALTTSATAAATAQALRGMNVPLFAACGDDQSPDVNAKPAANAPAILLDANGNPPGPSNPTPALPFHINSNAIYNASNDKGKGGPIYEISGPQVDNCGAGSSGNKGLLNPPVDVWGPSPPTSPSAWNDTVNTGLKSGAVRPAVANQPGCNLSGTPVGCVMLLPICDSAIGTGQGTSYRCEFFGSFQIVAVKANNNQIDVSFLGPSYEEAAYGSGSLGVPQTDEEYVVKLVV